MAHELPDFNEWWSFRQPDETEKRFRELLPRAQATGDRAYELQLRTQIARALGLQGRVEAAHQVLDEIEPQLTDEFPAVRMRYLLERGRTFNSSRQPDRARPLFLEAWEYGLVHMQEYYAVDAAHMMAFVEPPRAQLEWNLKATELAERSTDLRARKWLGTLYNNIGWAFHDLEQYDRALDAHRKCRSWYEEQAPGTRGARIAKWSVAKQLRHLGRVEEALAMQREVLATCEELGEQDGFVYEELGECLLAQGKPDEATPWFEKAHARLRDIAWVREQQPERWARLARLAEAQ